jgi:glycosyltransferase involved in cell wall biosynthesis
MSNSKNKKISIYLPSLLGGGAERIMVILANEFAMRDIQVDLVLSKAIGPYLKDVQPNIRIVNLNAKRLIYSIIPLIRYIRKEKPKVMLSALNSSNIIAVIARNISGIRFKLVISERAVSSVALKDNPLIRAKFIPLLIKVFYKKADAIIAVSAGVADDLVSQYNQSRDKISVVYNPIVTNQLIKLSNEKFSHKWFRNKEVPVILAIGRLTSQKNFVLLLDAFSLLLETNDARLVILGEGESKNNLIEQVSRLKLKDKVIFPGFETNPFKWMKNASLFVLSSDYEGLPGTLIQAMACGTPVVSTNCQSGPKEILENGKWGRLTPVGDVRLFAKAMVDTLAEKKHPDVKQRAQYFNVTNGVNGYLKVLDL